MPKVSAEHREKVRRRLLDAARRVVVRDGHEGATTRAILAEAGLSAGSLYNYFSSKEELFEAIFEDLIVENLTLLAAEPGPTSSSLLSYVAVLLSEPDFPALAWFRGRMVTEPDFVAAQARLNRFLVEAFAPYVADAQRDGQLAAEVDTEALTELVDLVQDGMNRRHALGTFVTDFGRVGATFQALLERGAITTDGSQP